MIDDARIALVDHTKAEVTDHKLLTLTYFLGKRLKVVLQV